MSATEWRQPWMDDEFVEWWQSLDHSNCGIYDMRDDLPMWKRCRDMHCPDCGKRTGSQGHRNCPERAAVVASTVNQPQEDSGE